MISWMGADRMTHPNHRREPEDRKTPDLILRRIPPRDQTRAVRIAHIFAQDHPDHEVGMRHFVIYGEEHPLVVYRTKTAIVVRPTGNGP